VVAVPRRMPLASETLPPKLTYITGALPNRATYIKAVIELLRKNSKFAVIGCGHIKLLPLAFLAKLIARAPVFLIIYALMPGNP